MGTTLTGTTPQDTYDSLIKVTDNGPLSGSLKTLTDGLGNDSALALSTSAIRVTGAISGTNSFNGFSGATQNLLIDWSSSSQMTTLTNTELFFGTNANRRLTITAAGNVGIGTSTPSDKLHVSGSGNTATFITGSGCTTYVQSVTNETRIGNLTSGGGSIVFSPADAERVRITSNGLTFNGDTAAANALDDYEEGTWTIGIAFGGASAGVAYANNTGTYTKIGRQVTVNGRLDLGSKGSSTGAATLTGLPFTIANTTGNWSAASLRFNNITFANQMQAFGVINTTTLVFTETTEAGVSSDLTDADFANNTDIMFSFTYFV